MTNPREIWPPDDPIWHIWRDKCGTIPPKKEPPMVDFIMRHDLEISFLVCIVIAYAIGWFVCKYDQTD